MSHLIKRLRLFRYPAFRWYLLSSVLATIGSGLSYIANTWFVLSEHNTVGSVAILMLCFWLPGVIFGPLMGAVVDRLPWRHHILVASTWLRAIILAVFGTVLHFHHSLLGIYAMGLLLGVGFSIFMPAAFRLTRELIAEEDLLYANATIDSTFELGNMVGMGLAGVLIAVFTAPGALIINAIMFSAAGGALLMIKKDELKVTREKARKLDLLADCKAGLSYIFSNKLVMAMYTIQLILFIEFLTAPVLLAPFARNQLHASVAEFGYIEMSLSFGAVVGGLFLSWFADRYGFMRTAIASTIILGCSFVGFCLNHKVVTAELIYFVIGVCISLWPLVITRAQHITEISFQGRVQSCFNSISGIVMIAIYLAVTLGDHWIKLQMLYWLEVGLCCLNIVLIVYAQRVYRETLSRSQQ